MNQLSLANGFERSTNHTRRQAFLEELLAVVPGDALVARIVAYAKGPQDVRGTRYGRCYGSTSCSSGSRSQKRPPRKPSTNSRSTGGLRASTRIPDATTLLRFRHLVERRDLATALVHRVNALHGACGQMVRLGTLVDATFARAPSSMKTQTGTWDPEVHQTRKGNQWFYGMKAHIGVDADSGPVYTVVPTPSNVHDLAVAGSLLHGD